MATRPRRAAHGTAAAGWLIRSPHGPASCQQGPGPAPAPAGFRALQQARGTVAPPRILEVSYTGTSHQTWSSRSTVTVTARHATRIILLSIVP
jgi:hypothetical protein